MSGHRRLLSAVIASAAVPGMVAGCVPTGPSSQEMREKLVVAVEAVPNVSGALEDVMLGFFDSIVRVAGWDTRAEAID